jgi:hypothetical protein
MAMKHSHDVFRAILVAAACVALPAGAAIFRCTAADGSVSYQEIECAATDKSRVMDVPTQYPNTDTAERQRLFEREAALDRRLEAQRERDSREAVAHAMQPPEQPIPTAADEGYPLAWGGVPVFQRSNMRPHRPVRNLGPKVNPLDRRG